MTTAIGLTLASEFLSVTIVAYKIKCRCTTSDESTDRKRKIFAIMPYDIIKEI